MRRATWGFDQAWFIWKDLPYDGASSPVLVPQTRSISLLVFNSRTTDCQLTWGGSQSYPLFTFTAVAEPSVTVVEVRGRSQIPIQFRFEEELRVFRLRFERPQRTPNLEPFRCSV